MDGATCHSAESTRDVLSPVFKDRIIPRSCDLPPLDYYLWGVIKYQCYADKPETIDALNYNVREAIGEIQLHTIDNKVRYWTDRVGYCMASRGSHLKKIIWRTRYKTTGTQLTLLL